MKIFTTGGSGFIGTNLLQKLLADGHQVLDFSLTPPPVAAHRAVWQRGDLLDAKALQAACKSFAPEVVIHLAARTECDESTTVDAGYRMNTDGTRNLLDAIRATPGVRRAIITSSQYVCGPSRLPQGDEDYFPHTIYGQSKVITEQITRGAALPCCWTIIRPTNIWGPWHARYPKEFWRIAARGLYVHPAGQPVVRCYGYVGNIVAQILRILDLPEQVVNKRTFYVGDPAADIYAWASGFCEAITGRSAPRVPRPLLRAAGLLGDLITAITRKPFYITSSRYRSMVTDYVTPMETTLEVLGKGPYSLEQGIEETVRWLREQGLVGPPKSHGSPDCKDETSAARRPVEILVLAQTPPPVHGQSLMNEFLLAGKYPGVSLRHVKMAFSVDLPSVGVFSWIKLPHVFFIWIRATFCRFLRGTSVLYYSPASPNKVPFLRDVLLLGGLRWMFPKTIFHFHSNGISGLYERLPRWMKPFYWIAYRKPDVAICQTRFGTSDAEHFGAKRIEIVPNGIPDAGNAPSPPLSPASPRELPVVLYLSILSMQKGAGTFLEALAKLKDRGVAFRAIMVGPRSSSSDAARLGKTLRRNDLEDCVEIRGPAYGEDKWQTYREADIFCFPTFYSAETFGLVNVEAMMFGLPVVSTRWRGIPCVVDHGNTGLLVPPGHPKALAKAIETLLLDPELRARMGAAGRRRYLERFTVERFRSNMGAVFRSLDSNNRPPTPDCNTVSGGAAPD